MLALDDVTAIVAVLRWLLTLGHSDLKHVKSETRELIDHLTASLKSRWDAVKQVTSLDATTFSKAAFADVYDYFTDYYVAPENTRAAKTHCSMVERDLKRIKFKLPKLLHSDLGKWGEADQHFARIVDKDWEILDRYEQSIEALRRDIAKIHEDLEADRAQDAKKAYLALKDALRCDVEEIRSSIRVMEDAYTHVEKIMG